MSIEAQACSPLLTDLVLWLPSKHCKCPTLCHSIGPWESTCRQWPLCPPHTPVAPLFNNPQVCHLLILVGGWSRGFTVWDILLPPPCISYRIWRCSPQKIYNYNKNTLQRKNPDLAVQTLFQNRSIKETLQRGCIFMLSKALVSRLPKLPYKTAGERNLGIASEEKDWQNWTTHIHNGIMNVSLIEAGYNVLARWYLPPEHLSKKTYPGMSPSCVSGVVVRWDPLFILCPNVCHFCIQVNFLIYLVTMVNVTKDPQIALLSEPVENIPISPQTLIYYRFLTAKNLPPLLLQKAKRMTWL